MGEGVEGCFFLFPVFLFGFSRNESFSGVSKLSSGTWVFKRLLFFFYAFLFPRVFGGIQRQTSNVRFIFDGSAGERCSVGVVVGGGMELVSISIRSFSTACSFSGLCLFGIGR